MFLLNEIFLVNLTFQAEISQTKPLATLTKLSRCRGIEFKKPTRVMDPLYHDFIAWFQ